jgi:hypothetical protein
MNTEKIMVDTDCKLIADAKSIIRKMTPTDMRVLIEEIGTTSTTGMTTAQLKARLIKMAIECDWMPDHQS